VPEEPCLGTALQQVTRFLKTFGCSLIGRDDIEGRIRAIARDRGEDWPWVDKWVKEEGPEWVNDMETLVFEVPLENLTGSDSLNFTHQVWMLQPSLFGYQSWGDRAFVRMWWNRDRSAFPGQASR
jgi:hypothetical protein